MSNNQNYSLPSIKTIDEALFRLKSSTELELIDPELLDSQYDSPHLTISSHKDLIFGVTNGRKSYSTSQVYGLEDDLLNNEIVTINNDRYLLGDIEIYGENQALLKAYSERTNEIKDFRVLFEEGDKNAFILEGRKLIAYRTEKGNFTLVEVMGYEEGNTKVKIISKIGKGLEYKLKGIIDGFEKHEPPKEEVA